MKNIFFSRMLTVWIVLFCSVDTVWAGPTSKVLGELVERVMKRGAKEGGEKALKEGVESSADHVVAKTLIHEAPVQHALPGSVIHDALRLKEGGMDLATFQTQYPVLAGNVVKSYGDDVARQLARDIPGEDLPRMIRYMDEADSAETRELLLQVYRKEGRSLFERIPPKLVLAGGLSTSMIYGTYRVTAPIAALTDKIEGSSPEDVLNRVERFSFIGLLILALIFVLVFKVRFKKFRKKWWRKKMKKTPHPDFV